MSDTSSASWQTYAAWVQALGSIGAILAASRIASRQWDQTQLLRLQDSQQRLLSFAEMLEGIARGQGRTANLLENPPDKMTIADLAGMRLRAHCHVSDFITRIPLHESPYVYVSGPVLTFLSGIESIHDHLKKIVVTPEHVQMKHIEEVWQIAGAMAGWAAEVREHAVNYDGINRPPVQEEKLRDLHDQSWEAYCQLQKQPVALDTAMHHPSDRKSGQTDTPSMRPR